MATDANNLNEFAAQHRGPYWRNVTAANIDEVPAM